MTSIGASARRLTDFPVYVDLADLGADFFTNVSDANGGDIRVTAGDGVTELPRQVVAINTGGQTGELHFKASSLSSTQNTYFYIYYGNAGESEPLANSTYGSQNVWTNGYVGVWHLEEDAAGITTDDLYKDSTDSSVSGAHGDDRVSATGKEGQVEAGQEFDGSDDYVRIAIVDIKICVLRAG